MKVQTLGKQCIYSKYLFICEVSQYIIEGGEINNISILTFDLVKKQVCKYNNKIKIKQLPTKDRNSVVTVMEIFYVCVCVCVCDIPKVDLEF